MDRQLLKEKLIEQISLFGDGKDEFETRDINELLNWIDELELNAKNISPGFFDSGSLPKVKSKDGTIYDLAKLTNGGDDKIHVWCFNWDGHHIVGHDCELVWPQCDYRKQECTNTGETINGTWVCSNHKRIGDIKSIFERFAQCYGGQCWNNGRDGIDTLPSGNDWIALFTKELEKKLNITSATNHSEESVGDEACDTNCQFRHFIDADGRVPCCKTWRKT